MGIAMAAPAGIQRRWQHRVVGRSTYNFAYSQDSFFLKTSKVNLEDGLAGTRLLARLLFMILQGACWSLRKSVAVVAPLLLAGREGF